jgi:aerobic-type carbon monoxide dehydrogenase small subunit (CoxS/CutS family)
VIEITFSVNGTRHRAAVDELTTVAELLRGPVGLQGTKIACGEGTCGACTVLVNGSPLLSCILLAAQVDGAELSTVEGLGQEGSLSPLQQAFIEEDAFQCGFCTPGQLMSAHAALEQRGAGCDTPNEEWIRTQMTGNVCRCTGYGGIARAVQAAASEEPEQDEAAWSHHPSTTRAGKE